MLRAMLEVGGGLSFSLSSTSKMQADASDPTLQAPFLPFSKATVEWYVSELHLQKGGLGGHRVWGWARNGWHPAQWQPRCVQWPRMSPLASGDPFSHGSDARHVALAPCRELCRESQI